MRAMESGRTGGNAMCTRGEGGNGDGDISGKIKDKIEAKEDGMYK